MKIGLLVSGGDYGAITDGALTIPGWLVSYYTIREETHRPQVSEYTLEKNIGINPCSVVTRINFQSK